MKKLIFFAGTVTAVVALIIISGVIELNPVDDFSETPLMAQNLVAEAIKLYEEIGVNSFPRISVDPIFHGKELSVFVIRDNDGTVVADGNKKLWLGKNIDLIVNVHDESIGKMIHDSATDEGTWVEYDDIDPVNKSVLPKSTWIVKHDGYIFGSGIFKPLN